MTLRSLSSPTRQLGMGAMGAMGAMGGQHHHFGHLLLGTMPPGGPPNSNLSASPLPPQPRNAYGYNHSQETSLKRLM